MYNNNNNNKNSFSSDHNYVVGNMSPRISFSNDFVESHSRLVNNMANLHPPPPPPVSSDFEFSVSNHSMMSADELFSKGRLLPFKNSSQQKTVSTLREELLTSGEDDNVAASSSGKPPKSGRWKGLLGLRKSHATSKKQPDNHHHNRSAFDNSQNFTGNSE
ncbi:hypothetical protein DCAR_0312377 [Daucus carota subsp. sativus]|uniref:Uncharacterized protein n=2 Tax=Daucus carota subsp. sativus TaxID=79200 RepID=A0AAF0WPQ9_DAUCS|nr:hypothetical protein DCAR_0312377 [Daucus carota subsp. sativus]